MKDKSKKNVFMALAVFSLIVGGLLAVPAADNLQGRLGLEVEEQESIRLVNGRVDGVAFTVDGVLSEDRRVVLRGPSLPNWLPGIYADSSQEDTVNNFDDSFTVYPFVERNGLFMFDERMDLPEGDYVLELWSDRTLVDSVEVGV